MAHRLTMAKIQAILGLHERGWRNRRIARVMEVDREAVTKYISTSCVPKPVKAPLGSDAVGGQAKEDGEGPLLAGASAEKRGIEASQPTSPQNGVVGDSKPTKVPIGSESKPAKDESTRI